MDAARHLAGRRDEPSGRFPLRLESLDMALELARLAVGREIVRYPGGLLAFAVLPCPLAHFRHRDHLCVCRISIRSEWFRLFRKLFPLVNRTPKKFRRHHIQFSMTLDLTDDEAGALAKHLRETLNYARFPLAPRLEFRRDRFQRVVIAAAVPGGALAPSPVAAAAMARAKAAADRVPWRSLASLRVP